MKFYTDVMGFAEDFRFGAYAGVRHDEAALHLCEHDLHQKPIGGSTAYFFCDEVDAYAEMVRKNGASVKVMPTDWPYGMRDFTVIDPDGNHLHFGCEVKRSH